MTEYKTGVDRVSAISILRTLHWGQHMFMLTAVVTAVVGSVTHPNHPPIDWPLAAMTAFAPALLRGSCRHWPPDTARFVGGMSPPYALETGLPVATLLSVLVLSWYSKATQTPSHRPI